MPELDTTMMTTPEATRVTELIRASLDRVSEAWATLARRVSEAYQRRADQALGYNSWQEYVQTEFGQQTSSLSTEVRRELVTLLSAEGMSTRAIAPVLSVDQATVSRDSQVMHGASPTTVVFDEAVVFDEVPPAPTDTASVERVDLETGEVITDATPTTPPVTGLDGKTYTPPKPSRKLARPPLYLTVEDHLRKAQHHIDAIYSLHQGDRWPSSRRSLADRLYYSFKQIAATLEKITADLEPLAAKE